MLSYSNKSGDIKFCVLRRAIWNQFFLIFLLIFLLDVAILVCKLLSGITLHLGATKTTL